MPIKPKPFVYSCPACGWRKIVAPRSDALMPGEYYDCCPTCDHTPLKREELGVLAEIGNRLFGKLIS